MVVSKKILFTSISALCVLGIAASGLAYSGDRPKIEITKSKPAPAQTKKQNKFESLHKIKIVKVKIRKTKKGNTFTIIRFDPIRTYYGDKTKQTVGSWPGDLSKYVAPGSTATLAIPVGWDDSAQEDPTTQTLPGFGLILLLSGSIFVEPGETPPVNGPAKPVSPPDFGNPGGNPGVVIVGPGGISGGGGGGARDPADIADANCNDPEYSDEDYQDCMDLYLIPDLEPTETDTGGGDTGDTGDTEN
jgi:hypothetical protein